MRVIAGTARRLPLKAPKGSDTRPTTDRIKETLFNILQNDVADSIFVDAFSGSGGIGIEALSRGAKKAYFLERSSAAAACILENLAFTKLSDRAIVVRQEVCGGLCGIREEKADIIFLDPPYGKDLERRTLETLARLPYVRKDTLMIAETALLTDFSYLRALGFTVVTEKIYKTNKHVFIQKEYG
ncbi:MAG: 16S rRNA (guanine(966)-N(2))-methyltransferase RsmD [Clostridium sp.]|nr:16S rRNA (guanine(966)-N(2))-methyltransferase RsmD [Clostridium sp.]